jgi:hypothetical protein
MSIKDKLEVKSKTEIHYRLQLDEDDIIAIIRGWQVKNVPELNNCEIDIIASCSYGGGLDCIVLKGTR